jgi:hypothetical protein
MPSERIANEIQRSLADGERFGDFAYLFDALMFLRAPYNHDFSLSELVVGRLLCIIFPDKPAKYTRAMQTFRLGFSGVSTSPELEAEFSNSVRRAAITLVRPDGIVWRPSLYFSLPPRLRELKDLREWWS